VGELLVKDTGLVARKPLNNGCSERRADATHLSDRLRVSALQLSDRTEMLEQQLHPTRPEAGDLGKHRRDVAFAALPLVCDCEAVRFIPNALNQEQRVAVARQNDRVVGAG
jgi:hypothetical protein